MITRGSIRNIAGGFTLLELLVAVIIFGLVLAAVNTVFFSALRLRNKATESMARALPIQQAIAIIKKDLANLVPSGGTLSGELQTTLTSSGMTGQSSPEFITSSGMIDMTSPWSEVQKVSYYLTDSTNQIGRKDLFRVVSRNLLSPSDELPLFQWLLGGVQQIHFSYMNGVAWQDAWDSSTEDTALPAAIKVQIVMEPEISTGNLQSMSAPIELVIPVVSQAFTNLTEEATEG